MANVVLKNQDGAQESFYGVNKIKLKGENNADVLFSVGNAQNATIIPDFSGGDMQIPVTEGTLIDGGTIIKPSTLIPANIANGINIAGVVGTHDSYPEPSGIKQIDIVSNGTTIEDVKDFASAQITVNVPSSSSRVYLGEYALQPSKTWQDLNGVNIVRGYLSVPKTSVGFVPDMIIAVHKAQVLSNSVYVNPAYTSGAYFVMSNTETHQAIPADQGILSTVYEIPVYSNNTGETWSVFFVKF